MKKEKPYLLFDAGGTLVFPNQDFLLKQARKNGRPDLSSSELFKTHCEMVFDIDEEIGQNKSIGYPWASGYSAILYSRLGLTGHVLERVEYNTRVFNKEKNLWAYCFPWIKEPLEILKDAGYRMSVISNADGRVNNLLEDMELAPYFEKVFDSKILGFEKPNPRIFNIALDELKLNPEDAIYIGDIYYIDIWGANNVGMGSVHLDPFQFYWRYPGEHLKDIRELPNWLCRFNSEPDEFNIFPAKEIQISYS